MDDLHRANLYHFGVFRLRQVVIAARDLEAAVDRLCTDLKLRVCFNDPGVSEFGLHNALLTVGDQFIEVVSPITNNTAVGRLLDRRKADVTAYMVMFEVDDLDARMSALDRAQVRTVWSGDYPTIRGRHLHPGDIGGAIVSLDQPEPLGSWLWAGPAWTAHTDNTGRDLDRRIHDRHRRPGGCHQSVVNARSAPLRAVHRWDEIRDRAHCHRPRQPRTTGRTRSGDASTGVINA